jgi:hypothetical protein
VIRERLVHKVLLAIRELKVIRVPQEIREPKVL